MSLSMFKDEHQEKANNLLNQFDSNTMHAALCVIEGDFSKAATHYFNNAHICNELQYMKNEKETMDQIVRQMKAHGITP
ncbi:hypothetical protein [Oceanobacillus kimchii]|uniref:Uncharacterized protein n=1 Tax=Oceanobacillus kimchii TaxID=746691 RepID=A0ABQ5TDE4_9BACI|nr:hypothetical protein [Oceanobacillus kimchii]GLO64719.1 hypothetical protein MACH08_05030 [Oceanobacillus kimchii]